MTKKSNMFIDLFKYLIELLTRGISFLIHPFFVKLISFILTKINTYFIIKQLKRSGKNAIIFFPTTFYGLENIIIGDNFKACSRMRLDTFTTHLNNKYTPEIIIGDNVSINYDCHIGCVNKIVIGDNVLIASKVFITDHFHGDTTLDSILTAPNNRKVISKGSVFIGNNVWIGEGVAIMPNVRIGNNCIIGANSVVTKSFPENSVVAGNPAKIIKKII